MRINTSTDSPISGILLNSERETTPSDLKPISIKISPLKDQISLINHKHELFIIDLHKDKRELEGVIGFVPQDDLLIEELTVFENLFYNSKLCFGNYSDAQIAKMCVHTLKSIGLYETKDLKVTKGQDLLKLYQYHTKVAEHYFCSNCGIYTHHKMRSNPNMYGINVACLEGVKPFELENVLVNDGENHPMDKK